jgi:hypothetical protein
MLEPQNQRALIEEEEDFTLFMKIAKENDGLSGKPFMPLKITNK